MVGSDLDFPTESIPPRQNFKNTWKEENVGIYSKLIFDSTRLTIAPILNIKYNVIGLCVLEFAVALFVASKGELWMLVVWAILSTLFTLEYARSLPRHIQGLPFFIERRNILNAEQTIHVRDIASILIRKNSNRTSDDFFVQLYLILSDGSHRLVRQERYGRQKIIFNEAIKLRDWINQTPALA